MTIANKKSSCKGKFVKGPSNGGKTYNFCNRNGQMVETCFKKHNFPPHYKKVAFDMG